MPPILPMCTHSNLKNNKSGDVSLGGLSISSLGEKNTTGVYLVIYILF